MPKKFLVVFGEGYAKCTGRADVQEHTIDFFSEDIGYDKNLRKDLDVLSVGQAVTNLESIPYTAHQTIVRIE